MFSLSTDRTRLINELTRLLGAEVDDANMIAGVEGLAAKYGDLVFKEALLLLVGKNFGSRLSRMYWQGALDHRQKIFRPEFIDGSFRPALMDYLHRIAGELINPRIIETDYLNNITRSSVTDGLTGLYNQTYLKKALVSAIKKQRRASDQSFALILFDLDHFKQYNDHCGHLQGDVALQRTAEIISRSLREGDIAARYGGEEFALLLPDFDMASAYAVAERIRTGIEVEPFPGQEKLERQNLTISGGIALYPDDGRTAEEIITVADKKLYKAKVWRNTILPNVADRRRERRRQAKLLVEYATFDGALFRPAQTLDISERGIGIGCETLLPQGATINLRLAQPYGKNNITITATVRQVKRQGEMVMVGLEFSEALTTLDQLIANQGE
jgi:diguanylate cyclase (GGDEF)-like protein